MTPTETVRAVLESYRWARQAMTISTGCPDARAVVRRVLDRDLPRQGTLDNGLEYDVHGIGYSVVMPSEAQVLIDAGDVADVFSAYDIEMYLDFAEDGLLPKLSIEQVVAALTELSAEGAVVELVEERRFTLPDWAG